MAVETPIRILSVEDHPVFREGLSTVVASQPDMTLVAHASNAAEAMSEFRHRPPWFAARVRPIVGAVQADFAYPAVHDAGVLPSR